MVKQFHIKAKTAQGRDTYVYLSEEVTGQVHIIAYAGGVYVDKQDLLKALEHLDDVVGDEHGENN
jgi:hypothetical protein